MQLTNSTDYAIRVVVFLASEGRLASSSEIAEKMGIPVSYLRMIAAPLRETGIIASHKGSLGGYGLAAPPESISLLDIIRITEGTTKINRCLEHDRYCSRFATESCPVRACYVEMQESIEAALAAMTIDKVVERAAAMQVPNEALSGAPGAAHGAALAERRPA